MKLFTQLITKLDRTTSINNKVKQFCLYLDSAGDNDKLWATYILSKKKIGRIANTSNLREWAADASGVPLWLLEESYYVVGDLAETLALLLPDEMNGSEITLHDLMKDLLHIKDLEDIEEKKKWVTNQWLNFSQMERFVFNKLLTGGWRVGMSQKLIARSLARHLGKEESYILYCLSGKWDPGSISFEDLFQQSINADDSKPYPFCLAYALKDSTSEIVDINQWQAEYKWDGIRGQIIKRSETVFIWSRGQELITNQFPEIQEEAKKLPNGTVLDGEILVIKGDEIKPFHHLQKRLGRKKVSKNIMVKHPVAFIAFDLLELNGNDIRNEKLSKRFFELNKILKNIERITANKALAFKTIDDLTLFRKNARSVNAEGLMLKDQKSIYHSGRKKGSWYKWKLDPYTIDAVLIYAQSGHGRRANLFTDYTFAVWSDDRQLVPVAKAYSGLTDLEFREVSSYVMSNTIERFGPVRSVHPNLVFEIAFEGISPSNRHKSGVAVRFPRIHRWRKDKKPEQADTLQQMKDLISE
ncbi:ATP-dependent DNA ligase [Membranihabitans maritimus]|uniref:ATP-dependent DNA ligase n=1 Tax=Membranihabitans maritimus TaxID=2904244 RepID=UPI001F017CE0|nr:ATP-dependent DNA ligase [Membranihabitans maritimus]